MSYSKQKPRPELLQGKTLKVETGCGDSYVTVNSDEDGPFEVFMASGKAGICAHSQCASLGVLISALLRLNCDPRSIVKKLKGITCQQRISCADAVARALEQVINEKGGE